MHLEVYPSEVLAKKARRVSSKAQARRLKRKLQYAITNLCWSPPLGLAAPQIGLDYQAVFVRDIFMVNPKVSHNSVKHLSIEGCFSERGSSVAVERYNVVTVEWKDEFWTNHVQVFEGRDADIVQHEVDHLKGITIMDIREKQREQEV